jgi:hypothetical protein
VRSRPRRHQVGPGVPEISRRGLRHLSAEHRPRDRQRSGSGRSPQARFERLDASKAIPGQYDLITTFDVIHDAVDPRGLLRTIREALRSGGTYLCLDINCSDKPEENTGPLASLFYGFSVVYCMTTSLANGGEGLGTCGLPESKLRELALSAGFGSVRKLHLENPFNNLYEVKP